jgi:hypothetical protein
METKIIETHGAGNWGKFLVARFTHERGYASALPEAEGSLPLARWAPNILLVLDLATGEGALFRPGGLPAADLEKHQVWVCPLFEGFLEWLYRQDLTFLADLPPVVHLPDNEFSFAGRRRRGLLGEAQRLLGEVGDTLTTDTSTDVRRRTYDKIGQAFELIRQAREGAS